MEKTERKKAIALLHITAALVKRCHDLIAGLCGICLYLDRRKPLLQYTAGAHLTPETFLDLLGPDTNYEYRTRPDGEIEMAAEDEGVTFYALIGGTEVTRDGRLI